MCAQMVTCACTLVKTHVHTAHAVYQSIDIVPSHHLLLCHLLSGSRAHACLGHTGWGGEGSPTAWPQVLASASALYFTGGAVHWSFHPARIPAI